MPKIYISPQRCKLQGFFCFPLIPLFIVTGIPENKKKRMFKTIIRSFSIFIA